MFWHLPPDKVKAAAAALIGSAGVLATSFELPTGIALPASATTFVVALWMIVRYSISQLESYRQETANLRDEIDRLRQELDETRQQLFRLQIRNAELSAILRSRGIDFPHYVEREDRSPENDLEG